jgi:hypothetical protein
VKKIRNTGITGQAGVNVIERVVLGMGSVWHPTGGLEAGTDGFIEFRDPTSGAMLNLFLPVQSKATANAFSSETDISLAFTCERDDLDYWMQGNCPIILVVSRPRTNEAYWVSVKDYFSEPKVRQNRKVVFDKVRDRFDASARDRLIAIASPKDQGRYFAPARKPEQIVSNLLRVSRFPEKLYHGYTDCSRGSDVRRRLTEQGAVGMDEWAVRGRRIVSVYDLSAGPWRSICDQGTVEQFGPDEWALSSDHDARSDFIELLGQCLWTRLGQMGARYDREEKHYYFIATADLSPRVVHYRSFARDAQRDVFRGYPKKTEPEVMAYYRHHAFEGRFRDYDGEWYLQIDPTYRYSVDGYRLDKYSATKLSGMRKLEKNPAVAGQVVMWAALLSDDGEQDFFASPPYPHLGFSELATFECPVGINDAVWLESDENPNSKDAASQAADLDLFVDSEEAG